MSFHSQDAQVDFWLLFHMSSTASFHEQVDCYFCFSLVWNEPPLGYAQVDCYFCMLLQKVYLRQPSIHVMDLTPVHHARCTTFPACCHVPGRAYIVDVVATPGARCIAKFQALFPEWSTGWLLFLNVAGKYNKKQSTCNNPSFTSWMSLGCATAQHIATSWTHCCIPGTFTG